MQTSRYHAIAASNRKYENGTNEHNEVSEPLTVLGTDCGCKGFQCRSLQKYATSKCFIVVLCLLTFLHSAIQETFLNFAVYNNKFNISPTVTDWLIVSDGTVQILLAALIGYYFATYGSTPAWLAVAGIVQSIACCSLHSLTKDFVKEINVVSGHTDLSLCDNGYRRDVHPKWNKSWELLSVLFGFQSISTVYTVCWATLGFAYIDNNVPSTRSPLLIGFIISMKYFGIIAVRIVLWFRDELELYAVDRFIWYCLGIALFILSLLISLFPERLDCTKTLSNGVLNKKRTYISNAVGPNKTGYRTTQRTGFISTLRNILYNKKAVFVVLAVACVQTVVFNSSAIEDDYFKSVFFVDTSSSTDVISMFRLPTVGVVIILTGCTICTLKPRMSRLLATNVIIVSTLTILSVFSMFLRCSELTLYNDYTGRKTLLDACNQGCQCLSWQEFSPVCPHRSSVVYYSPCHAGCREAYVNMEFWKCACVPTTILSADNCKVTSCVVSSVIFRISVLISIVLLSVMIVISVMILIRCVKRFEKSLTIGIQLLFSSVLVHIVGKLFYEIIKRATCSVLELEECKMNNAVQFSTFINLLNTCWLMAACAFFVMAWYNIKDVQSFPAPEPIVSPETESLYFSNPRSSLTTKSNSISAIPLSDNNPFRDDIIREFSTMSPKEAAKSEMDLNIILRQNQFDGKGVTIRKNGILTTIL